MVSGLLFACLAQVVEVVVGHVFARLAAGAYVFCSLEVFVKQHERECDPTTHLWVWMWYFLFLLKRGLDINI